MEPLRGQDPRRLGDFILLARLGSGGMGRVYLGRSPGGIQVAIKVIREDFADDSDVLARFRREVATVRAVRSPYTARLVSASLESPYWLATEFVPGPTLLMASRGAPLEPALYTGVFAALAEALAEVHGHGVVHRDVKPHNVILAAGGPQLIDFGIARAGTDTKLTRTGQTPGTPGYTAPEVLLGGEASPAADVFALGATMAAAATGRAPYGAGEWPAVSYRVVHGEIDVGGVELGLAELIRQCVDREPARRPDPLEIVRRCGVTYALAELPSYRRLSETSPLAVPPTPLRRRRRRAPLMAAIAAAAGVLAATTVWLLPEGGGAATADSPTACATSSPSESVSGGDGSRETLTIGIAPDDSAMSWCTRTGEYVGFEVDIARYIAGELGLSPEKDIVWRELPASGGTDLVASGAVDFAVARFPMGHERGGVGFVGPYLSVHQDLLTRADDKIADVTALNNRKLCAVTGSTSAQAVKEKAPGVDIVDHATYTDCLTALDGGKVDAVTADDGVLAGYANSHGQPFAYRLSGLDFSTTSYGVAVSADRAELRRSIDKAIGRMIANGSWRAAVERNLRGVDNYDPQPPDQAAETG
ncbi:Serine/threonine-protein kinase PknD [Streptomyces sp. RB5]|uniref:Serine/threonine-protein kinase PknD n=1 Tax=Streptomyces smaragdinus TaxID=2585196 RepID=A0A7K0CCF9_9ACTN|nr:serine/threonine-protein kinase [Streptomyces smaragdinus]MQY11093.1 Serine/threonine-protein kinase PknD [Streptomyces smaragdinus]